MSEEQESSLEMYCGGNWDLPLVQERWRVRHAEEVLVQEEMVEEEGQVEKVLYMMCCGLASTCERRGGRWKERVNDEENERCMLKDLHSSLILTYF